MRIVSALLVKRFLGELWLLSFMNTNEQCFNEYGLSSFLQAIDAGDISPDVGDFNEEAFIKEIKNAWCNVPGDEFVDETQS